MMSGLGLRRELSWDQKRGMEPRCCTTELTCPVPGPIPVSSFITNCSVSTSLATRPLSFTPLFKYPQREHTCTLSYPIESPASYHRYTMYGELKLCTHTHLVPAKWRDRLPIRVMTKIRPKIESFSCVW